MRLAGMILNASGIVFISYSINKISKDQLQTYSVKIRSPYIPKHLDSPNKIVHIFYHITPREIVTTEIVVPLCVTNSIPPPDPRLSTRTSFAR
jgi:hypothetical protein